MDQDKKVRVLIAKPGLDGHERGARVVAYGLRDAGYEVIYTGLRQTPGQIAKAAVDEDVDAVGLSILSGAHMSLTAEVMDQLKSLEAEDIVVLLGGIIPEDDIPGLKEMGVSEVFTSGSTIASIAESIHSNLKEKQARQD